MRKLLAALAAAGLVALGMTSITVAGGDPFTRTWSATDVDGSILTLTFVGTGDTRSVTYSDSRATGCGGGPWAASGVGTINANEIDFSGTGGCVGDPPAALDTAWTYLPVSGTLTDGYVTYHRGTGAREAFLGVWTSTDVDGSAQKLTFRGTGLTRSATYLDDLASSCDPDAVFMASGTGVIGSVIPWGRYITVSLEGSCVGGASIDVAAMYRYAFETDTLRGPLDLGGNEIFGTVDWHRG